MLRSLKAAALAAAALNLSDHDPSDDPRVMQSHQSGETQQLTTAPPPAATAWGGLDLDAQDAFVAMQRAKLLQELHPKIHIYSPNASSTSNATQDVFLPRHNHTASMIAYRCTGPARLWPREFGIQLASDLPILYHRRHHVACCSSGFNLALSHFYYFLPSLSEISSNITPQRERALCESPSQAEREHLEREAQRAYDTIKADRTPSAWEPPPLANFFKTPLVMKAEARLPLPLLLIANKFDAYKEYINARHVAPHRPFLDDLNHTGNFISVVALEELFKMLQSRFTIVYFRFERSDGMDADDHASSKAIQKGAPHLVEKVLLRRRYPGVVLFDDFTANFTLQRRNLWLLSVASMCHRFISVQGGTSWLFSYFGGVHIVQGSYGAGPQVGFQNLERLSRSIANGSDANEGLNEGSQLARANPDVQRVLHARTNEDLIKLARQFM